MKYIELEFKSGMLSTQLTYCDGRPARERAAEQERIAEIQRQLRMRPEELRTERQENSVVRIFIVDDYYDAFREKEIRHNFIKCVYMILCLQLMLTAGEVCFFKYYEPANEWLLSLEFWPLIGVSIGLLVLIVAVLCCESCRKTFPLNLIMLFIITLLYGMLLAYTVVHYPTDAVLLALGCTSAVVIALTIFACQTRCDFTVCYGVLITCVVVFIFMGLAAIFIQDKIYHIVYASLGVVIFSIFLIFDTQRIIGGKAKYPIAPDEYILGALSLYLDICLIFLYILELINFSQ